MASLRFGQDGAGADDWMGRIAVAEDDSILVWGTGGGTGVEKAPSVLISWR